MQDACRGLGLLEGDTERDCAMTEAASIPFGVHLCDLFATTLTPCLPSNPMEFYTNHKLELCRNIMRKEGQTSPTEVIENDVLLDLQERIEREGLDLHKDFKLPRPNPKLARATQQPRLLGEETSYDIATCKQRLRRRTKL